MRWVAGAELGCKGCAVELPSVLSCLGTAANRSILTRDTPPYHASTTADAVAGSSDRQKHSGQQVAQDAGHARVEPCAFRGEDSSARGGPALAAGGPQRQVRDQALHPAKRRITLNRLLCCQCTCPHSCKPHQADTLPPPTTRVGVQLALLLRNICQFDFPGSWQNPIDALLAAANLQDPTSGGQLAPDRGLRALKALKQVLRGLQTKRFVAEGHPPGTRKWGVCGMTC